MFDGPGPCGLSITSMLDTLAFSSFFTPFVQCLLKCIRPSQKFILTGPAMAAIYYQWQPVLQLNIPRRARLPDRTFTHRETKLLAVTGLWWSCTFGEVQSLWEIVMSLVEFFSTFPRLHQVSADNEGNTGPTALFDVMKVFIHTVVTWPTIFCSGGKRNLLGQGIQNRNQNVNSERHALSQQTL